MLLRQGERLADIVLSEPEARPETLGKEIDASSGSELLNVSFAYCDAEPEVLRRVSLAIEPGESVAIVGPSGCGKTTLLKVMLGIHAPQGGEIRIGGRSLRRVGLRGWRDMIGTVMQ